jgi:histidyl-tRNA synthetase
LEPSEIYKEKSGEEIVNEQTYTFTDRGGREVTLRPEMTPTVVRMISARRRELGFPVRWYSIQNLFRYEATQRGRLREHWQLNADVFGIESLEADIEVIMLARTIMHEFGAKESDYEIRINYSGDKSEKLGEIVGQLEIRGVKNLKINPDLKRGQAYYTGMIFELFDTDKNNSRSILGGGRYDDLMNLFDSEAIPAVGFGAGDVTMCDFLETHNLLPEYKNSAVVALLPLGEKFFEQAEKIAGALRMTGVNTFVDWSGRKVGDQIKHADKQYIPFTVVVGEDEIQSGIYKLKNLKTGEERGVKLEEIAELVPLESGVNFKGNKK